MSAPEPPPCPYCSSASFAWIDRAILNLTSDLKIGFGNVLKPEVSLLACRGCGHVAWFLRDHDKTLAGIQCEPVTASQKVYR